MYLKLSIRSARRSLGSYLIYIVTMILLMAVMEASNYLSVAAEIGAGFRTASLPVLILTIMVILACCLDTFMMKSRAVEFASYLLLGMDKGKLSWLFLGEFVTIGFFCLLAGAMAGAGAGMAFSLVVSGGRGIRFSWFGRSFLHTFIYFCLMEGLSAFVIKRRMDRLEIRELMQEKSRSQYRRRGGSVGWGLAFIISFLCFAMMLGGIVFLPESAVMPVVAVIAVPLLACIVSFYQWLSAYLCAQREKMRRQSDCPLYKGDRLYMTAQITARAKSGVWIDSIFSVCLLFSMASFLTGVLMLRPEFPFFDGKTRQWMGMVQLSLCIIFSVIYFSVLSLQEMIRQKEEKKNIQILQYMGKSRRQTDALLRRQIAVRMFRPLMICVLFSLLCIPLLNRKLNTILPLELNGILPGTACVFWMCFMVLYGVYFLLAVIALQKSVP